MSDANFWAYYGQAFKLCKFKAFFNENQHDFFREIAAGDKRTVPLSPKEPHRAALTVFAISIADYNHFTKAKSCR